MKQNLKDAAKWFTNFEKFWERNKQIVYGFISLCLWGLLLFRKVSLGIGNKPAKIGLVGPVGKPR